MDMISVSNMPTRIKTGRLPKVSLKGNETANWNNFNSTVAEAKGNDTFIGTVLIPVSQRKPKVELKEVGENQILTCQLNGEAVKYEVSKGIINRTSR